MYPFIVETQRNLLISYTSLEGQKMFMLMLYAITKKE